MQVARTVFGLAFAALLARTELLHNHASRRSLQFAQVSYTTAGIAGKEKNRAKKYCRYEQVMICAVRGL